MDEFYCVIDPTENSTLDGIMWRSTALQLCNWARGRYGPTDRNIKIYYHAMDAKIDAKSRMEKRVPRFDIFSEVMSHMSSLKNAVDVDCNARSIFARFDDGDTYRIDITKLLRP